MRFIFALPSAKQLKYSLVVSCCCNDKQLEGAVRYGIVIDQQRRSQ